MAIIRVVRDRMQTSIPQQRWDCVRKALQAPTHVVEISAAAVAVPIFNNSRRLTLVVGMELSYLLKAGPVLESSR